MVCSKTKATLKLLLLEKQPMGCFFTTTMEASMSHENEIEWVKRNGRALEMIPVQDENLCMAAVNANGLALQFVRKQTEALCIAAVRQNAKAIQFVNEEFKQAASR